MLENIPDKTKKTLFNKFSSEEKINKILRNKQLYLLTEELSTAQLQKLFTHTNNNPLSETNSKKVYSKIIELLKNYIANKNTEVYPAVFLYPDSRKEIYELRKHNIKEILNINFEDKQIMQHLKDLGPLKENIPINHKVISFSDELVEYFYNKYKFRIEKVEKEELENIDLSFEKPIIVADEDCFLDIPQYSRKEFENIIEGSIIFSNKDNISNLLELIKKFNSEELEKLQTFSSTFLERDISIPESPENIIELLNEDSEKELKELSSKTIKLNEEIEVLNQELKEIISKKKVSLEGDELLELVSSGDMSSLQEKFKGEIKNTISEKEKTLLEPYKKKGINVYSLFKENSYPVELDEEVKEDILKKIEEKRDDKFFSMCEKIGKNNPQAIKDLIDLSYFIDFGRALHNFSMDFNLNYPDIGEECRLIEGRNIFVEHPSPIDYGLGTYNLKNQELNGEKVSILTGANSGGKTTLLELFLQTQILTCMGMGIPASENSIIKSFEEIVYLKKFSGTVGSGAFEQTVKALLELLEKESEKLILIDEFEAITEPGAAAKILTQFLKEINLQKSFCISVSHLGLEIKEFIEEENLKDIRIDGITARGLDEEGNIITDHQPTFYELGKSTPELILKRIYNDEKFWKNKSKTTKEILGELIK